MKESVQPADSLRMGGLLAAIGGFLDSYTYIARGGVFANAQTGNLVLLGLRLAEGRWLAALTSLTPILAFVLGVVVAEGLRLRFWLRPGERPRPRLRWLRSLLAAQGAVLLAVGFVPLGCCDLAVNSAVSFVCAMQVQGFRTLRGSPYATTMCTGNLRSGTDALLEYLRTREKAPLRTAGRYFAVIGIFLLGAVAGGFATHFLGAQASLVCVAALALGMALLRLE